jgi:hypothetical protein
MGLKLTSSMDDIVWLVPFLVGILYSQLILEFEVYPHSRSSSAHTLHSLIAQNRINIVFISHVGSDRTIIFRNMAIYALVGLLQTLLALLVSSGIAELDTLEKSGKGW